ncbi:MAG: aryl-alcohol dehydrogenase-like predicted oxidoreductase [Lentisphaeria bacterium]|jgi:aryl-alcohol dehydrogenase-like predicted oxidoreductase
MARLIFDALVLAELHQPLERLQTDYQDVFLAHSPLMEVLNTTDAQVLELLFNMLRQQVRSAFGQIREQDIGGIVKVPLGIGWLTGKYHKYSQFYGVRARGSQEQLATRAVAVAELQFVSR